MQQANKKEVAKMDAMQIKEHMEVRGSDGQHVGTVDHVEGDRIKLTRSDPASGGDHHYLPVNSVQEIKDGAVCLSMTADKARNSWQ
ncbi:MAG: DUF2171 domain-containing protein [Hyphomicrobiaceae bacterium]